MKNESKEMNRESSHSRRHFLRTWGMLVPAFFSAGAFLSACGGGKSDNNGKEDKSTASAPTDCADLTGVSEAELEKRKSLGYVEETPMPESHCGNCQLYILPEKEGTCGGCMLFKGPVFEQGYCTYWAAKG